MTLGSFWRDDDGNSEKFTFSRVYLDDPKFTREEALDLIRHEYAHYMANEVYGTCGHDVTWKICCKKVGANPLRLYNEDRKRYLRNKHKEEDEMSEMCNIFECGMKIIHPQFGQGEICDINGEGAHKTLLAEFSGNKQKKLSAYWTFINCRFV